jgi:nucleoside-diphosphate-sugar epimerase
MRILVTGGTGFVGLALTERLLALGHQVRLLALDGSRDLLRDPALAGAELHRGDIRDPDVLATALDGVGAVVHLAAITPDAQHEVTDPGRIIDVNVAGTAALMCAVARHVPHVRVLAVSSVAVYGTGEPVGDTWDEEIDLPAPASLYGITKQAAEQVATYLAKANGTDLVIGRLGPVFGPWEHYSGMRPLLSPQAQALALAVSGQQIVLPRALAADWLYSRDAGNALAALLLAAQPAHRVFNIGAGRVVSVADWCEAVSANLPHLQWHIAAQDDTPNVRLTLDRDRAPLAVSRLSAVLSGPPSRPLSDCVQDHLAWMLTQPDSVFNRRNQQ